MARWNSGDDHQTHFQLVIFLCGKPVFRPYKRRQLGHALLADTPWKRLVVPRLTHGYMMGALEIGVSCMCVVNLSAKLHAGIACATCQDRCLSNAALVAQTSICELPYNNECSFRIWEQAAL